MKKITTSLLLMILLISSCTQSISKEEKDKLKSEIESLNLQKDSISHNLYQLREELNNTNDSIINLETKLNILKSGKTPKYILGLHFQEHKFGIHFDKISFDFEIPVDEEFYNESRIGEQLGSGSRIFKFFHTGDITVTKKIIK